MPIPLFRDQSYASNPRTEVSTMGCTPLQQIPRKEGKHDVISQLRSDIVDQRVRGR